MAKHSANTPSGPSQRQLRVGEVIRRCLSEVLARGDLHDSDLSHVSITVGEVRPTTDLRQAVVHVLPLGGVNAETVIAALNRNTYELRKALNKNLTLKYSPELKFVYDHTFDQMDETRRLLNQEKVQQDLLPDPE
jgi:ribosome-binding factor A